MPDAGLRKLFKLNVRDAVWTPVETGTTMAGVPDAEYAFPGGVSGWVEFKATRTDRIKRTKSVPFQIAWHERRAEMGGRTFVAVRQMRGQEDVLWLFRGVDMRDLVDRGLRWPVPMGVWRGGPGKWSWQDVSDTLGRCSTRPSKATSSRS